MSIIITFYVHIYINQIIYHKLYIFHSEAPFILIFIIEVKLKFRLLRKTLRFVDNIIQ